VKTSVSLALGSLTDGPETVLINASNTNAQLGSGVSGAIRVACGPGYQKVLDAALLEAFGGPMAPGEVLVTHAGNHPTAKWVAHVAVMDYREGFTADSMPTLELVQAGCERLWGKLEVLGESVTVAMVALGAGTGNLSVLEPTRIAAQTLVDHLAKTPDSRLSGVRFYGYLLHEYLAMARVLRGFFPEVEASFSDEVRQAIASFEE
jgi:O-acetyl-ADP-ribose deacetylase (regulator of RNase III)